jgi:hypothetical protein
MISHLISTINEQEIDIIIASCFSSWDEFNNKNSPSILESLKLMNVLFVSIVDSSTAAAVVYTLEKINFFYRIQR